MKRGSQRWNGNNEGANLTKVAPLASEPEIYEEEAERIIRRRLHHRETLQQKLQQRHRASIQECIRARKALRDSQKLQKMELFKNSSTDAIGKVIAAMEYRKFEAGEDVVTEGDAASELVVLMQGSASVYCDDTEVRKFGSLDIIGEEAIVSEGHMHGATVTAVCEVAVLVLTKERFDELKEDGTIAQETIQKARRTSKRYSQEDAARLASLAENMDHKDT